MKSCSKLWCRATNIVSYSFIITAYLIVFPKLFTTAKKSAHRAYVLHKRNFYTVLVMLLSAMVLRTILCSFDIVFAYSISYTQWNNFFNDFIILFPIFVYTYVVSREEDCLTCFNRFEEIHFSRYQVRRDNSIEKETW